MESANPYNDACQTRKSRVSGAFRCLLLGSFLLFLQPAQGQTSYIKRYKPLADSLSEVYGVPASVILGVAIIESGAGTSRNAKLLNNHFGIVGKNNLLRTKGIRSRYKQYPTAAASYAGFCQLLSRKRFYAKLKGNNDYKVWLEAMSKSGYSESPAEWKKRVGAAIRKHKLSDTP
ncbi:MAG: glucosaminidase domain-containing protein [Chitinophagaceae bacterium]|nr:glucosaminidase domain-containing protein [Chitinophagaceae bacterium]